MVQTVLVRRLTAKFGLSKSSLSAVTVTEQTLETTCSQIVEMLVSILFLIAGFCKFPSLRWPAHGQTRGKYPARRHPCSSDKHISKNDNFLTSNILYIENLHWLACYQLSWQPYYLFCKEFCTYSKTTDPKNVQKWVRTNFWDTLYLVDGRTVPTTWCCS